MSRLTSNTLNSIGIVGMLAVIGSLLIGGVAVWLGVALLVLRVTLSPYLPSISTDSWWPSKAELLGLRITWLALCISLQAVLLWRVVQYIQALPIRYIQWYGVTVQLGMTSHQLMGAILSAMLFQYLGIVFSHELAQRATRYAYS